MDPFWRILYYGSFLEDSLLWIIQLDPDMGEQPELPELPPPPPLPSLAGASQGEDQPDSLPWILTE